MNKISTAVMLMSLLGLTACATGESVPTPRAAQANAPEAPLQSRAITGSRIPSKTTEKMVSAVGGQDYADDVRGKMMPLPVK